ncbi:MAG: hypothetical protein WCP31_08425 [Chloroflexales bacterium]
MDLAAITNLLARTPIVLQGHPALLTYLPPEIEVVPTLQALLARLDEPHQQHPTPLVTFDSDSQGRHRIPLVTCATDPYTAALNAVIATRYDTLAAHTLRQSELGNEIVKVAQAYEVVVLLLIDGLAYRDVLTWPDQLGETAKLAPCLAANPTITRICFPQIIGNPPIAARLFDLGFTTRVGFSYWARADNELTDQLFATIRDVRRCKDMKEVLTQLGQMLSPLRHERVFVQIVRMGLDSNAHHMRELPPLDALRQQLLTGVKAVMGLLRQIKRHALVVVTSDHGILWAHEFTPQVIGHATGSARYAPWREDGSQQGQGLRAEVDGELYVALPYPLLRRKLRSDEAGLHGGVSFQESVTPFLTVEVLP